MTNQKGMKVVFAGVRIEGQSYYSDDISVSKTGYFMMTFMGFTSRIKATNIALYAFQIFVQVWGIMVDRRIKRLIN